MQASSKNYNNEGLLGSGILHALLLLAFAFLFSMSLQTTPLESQGVLVNFGTAEAGWGNEQPLDTRNLNLTEVATLPANNSAPTPNTPIDNTQQQATSTPQNANNKALTNPADFDAPDIEAKNSAKQNANNTTPVPVTEKNKSTTKTTTTNTKNTTTPKNNNTTTADTKPTPTPPKKPEIDPNSLFKGNKNNSTSQGKNPNAGGADAGSTMGSAQISDNTKGQSTGLTNDGLGGWNLTGRRLIKSPDINDQSQEVGTVVVRIKVDKLGKIIAADFQSTGSTTTSTTLRQKAITAAKTAAFNAITEGPEVQVGTMTFAFRLK